MNSTSNRTKKNTARKSRGKSRRRPKSFQDMADELSMPHKLLYSLREVSRATGVDYGVLREECMAGRLKSHLPEGRTRGRMIRPEWVDEWIEEGTHGSGIAAA